MVKRWIAWLLVLVAQAACLAAVETTTITGTVVRPDSSAVTLGTVTATLSTAGTAPDGASSVVVAASTTASIAANGAVSIVLVPNDVITPSGTYYIVKYSAVSPSPSASWTEKWTVTTAPDPITIGNVTRIDTPPGVAAPVSTIQDEGTAVPKRTALNFIGAGVSCADDSSNSRTNCTIGGGGAGGTPGGNPQDVQVNVAGNFGNVPGFTATTGGAVTVKSLNGVRKADQFSGSDACARIAAAIADLPSTGGIVDARGLVGAQSCASNPFASETKAIEVRLGAGTITTTAQWALPNKTVVIGLGRDVTILKADPAFPTSTALVRLGQGLETIGITGTRVENMQIDCNTVAGSIGLSSTEINELSGGNHLLIQKFMSAGIKLTKSGTQIPASYVFDDVEMYSDTTATAADGVYIGTGVGARGLFRRLTVNNLGGGHVQPRGIYLDTGAFFYDVNVEYATDGFYLDTNAEGSIEMTNLSSSGTTVVRIKGSGAFNIRNLKRGVATNILVNDYLGSTITDAYLPAYTTTTTANGYQAYSQTGRTVGGSSGANVEALVAPNWSIKSKESPPATGASVAAVSFLDNNNDGMTWRNSSPTAAPPGFMSLQNYRSGSITTTPFQVDATGAATFLGAVTSTSFVGTATGNIPRNAQVKTACASGCDYSTIQAGLNAANGTSMTPYVLLVMPGTYSECLTLNATQKYTTLLGASRDSTILSCPAASGTANYSVDASSADVLGLQIIGVTMTAPDGAFNVSVPATTGDTRWELTIRNSTIGGVGSTDAVIARGTSMETPTKAPSTLTMEGSIFNATSDQISVSGHMNVYSTGNIYSTYAGSSSSTHCFLASGSGMYTDTEFVSRNDYCHAESSSACNLSGASVQISPGISSGLPFNRVLFSGLVGHVKSTSGDLCSPVAFVTATSGGTLEIVGSTIKLETNFATAQAFGVSVFEPARVVIRNTRFEDISNGGAAFTDIWVDSTTTAISSLYLDNVSYTTSSIAGSAAVSDLNPKVIKYFLRSIDSVSLPATGAGFDANSEYRTFSDSADNNASWRNERVSDYYQAGSLYTPSFKLYWRTASATSGSVSWRVGICASAAGVAIPCTVSSFTSTGAVTVNGTAGTLIVTSGSLPAGILAAGSALVVTVQRDGDGSVATDSATGNAELLGVEISYGVR